MNEDEIAEETRRYNEVLDRDIIIATILVAGFALAILAVCLTYIGLTS